MIAIAVKGARDTALIELVYRRRRADSFIARIDRHAARAERHRLRWAAIVGEGLQIDLRGGCHCCAAASCVISQIVAVGAGWISNAIFTRAVGDDSVLERRRAAVFDAAAYKAGMIAVEGAVAHVHRAAVVDSAALSGA